MMKSISTSRLGHFTLLAALVALPACEGPTGPQGDPGADGNANVTTISLDDADVTWTEGDYLGRTANEYTFNPPEVTQDVVDHGTVLGYFNLFGETWHPMPWTWENGDGSSRQHITFTYDVEEITLYAYQTSGTLNPGITEYRFLTMTDNTVTTSASSGESIEAQLDAAGVDIDNYHEVAEYLGVSH